MTTITIDRALLEQALEALEASGCLAFKDVMCRCSQECRSYTAAKALRAALAQEQAESPCACWPGRLCSRQAQCAADVRKQQAEPVQEPDSPERRCGGPGCDGTCCQPVQEPVNDILRMAREAGGWQANYHALYDHLVMSPGALERFYNLARAAESEACARVCEEYTDNGNGNVEDHEGHGHHLAAILRARSKA